MSRVRVLVVVLTVTVAFGSPVLAQETEPDAEQSQQTVDEQQGAERQFEGEVTVTGTLIPRPSLDSLSPVTVMEVSEEFALAGTTRIEDLLTTLPQVFPGQNSTVSNGATGTASVDLRFLGVQRTLALVNGRRMAFGDQYAADINAVPGPLVKRADVLTGGASTVYGSDAMAGVVNFVLDTDFTGVRGSFQYSTYQHDNRNELAQQINADAGFDYPSGVTWDGATINGFVAAGGSFADGRGHGSVYVDYRQIDELTKSNRDYMNCAADAGEDGPYCSGSMTTAQGTWVAYNADYSFNGVYTLDLVEEGGDGHSFRPWRQERFNYGPWNYIQRPDEKWNGGGFAHYTISDGFEPYLEVMFMRDYSEAQIAPSGNFGVTQWIHCSNPMLSEQQRDVICTQAGYGPDDYAFVVIRRRNVEGDARSNHIGHTNYRFVAGLRGDIGDSWSYDLYGLYAGSQGSLDYVNDLNVDRIRNAIDVIEDPATGEWVCRSGSDDGCVPWNIFREGGVTREALDYISTAAMAITSADTHVTNLTFRGDLEGYGLTIPSASEGLQVAAGAEYRSEFWERRSDEVYATGAAGFGSGRPSVQGSFDVRELFIEALVPIVQDTPGARDFSLEVGYRYSDYSTSGGFNTYKGLLNWAITNSWRLRGGYNRAVRSPNIWELFRPQDWTAAGGDICANDPDTGVPEGTLEECLRTGMTEDQYGTIPPYGGVNAIAGGNPLLEPEVADTVTAGVVWTPQKITGLSITADYYKIDIADVIFQAGAGAIILMCATTGDPVQCGRIHRDELGSLFLLEDALVDDTDQNFQLLSAEGIDLNLAYVIGLGDAGYLNANLVGSYVLANIIEDPLIAFDCAGYFGPWCGQPNPRWRHRLRATWETNFNLSLSLAWRRVGSSEHSAASPDPNISDPDFMETARINDIDRIPAYDWFDLAASYTWRNDIQLTVGVNNIFDQEPPLMPGLADWAGTFFNLYGNYDPLGRYIFANLRFTF